jgi:hypothetical protein
MRYKLHTHRNGEELLRGNEYHQVFEEVLATIESVTDQELIDKHLAYKNVPMSLSRAINDVLKKKLVAAGWKKESPIFQGDEYTDKTWRLDFAKAPISIEVGFNHGEAIAWNLLKPVLASELNHVQKAIQTKFAIIIAATKELKTAGAFDPAVGECEKLIRYLQPLNAFLTVPMVIIGLRAPQTFRLEKVKKAKGHTSRVVMLSA